MPGASVCQIALSVSDLDETKAFYSEVFGLVDAGETSIFRGFVAEKMQGLPKAASHCGWMISDQPFMQLEIFEFERPKPRPKPANWNPADIGFNSFALTVRDFDAVLDSLNQHGHSLVTAPVYLNGLRRCSVYDPDGILVEIIEAENEEMPETVNSRFAGITLVVEHLEKSAEFFQRGFGLKSWLLNQPERDFIYGIGQGAKRSLTLDLGWGWLELKQYSGCRSNPKAHDYRLSDLGILNIAMGYRKPKALKETYRRLTGMGVSSNSRPISFGYGCAVYTVNDEGTSVELLQMYPWADSVMGFIPPGPITKAINGFITRIIRMISAPGRR